MSSSSPCAACKLLRRKCTPECIFAPHFPPNQPAKFANVHRVFGASNVAKLLNQLSPEQREDAVTSLAYEAEARLRDPVHGCVGYIYLLQHRLREVQHDLSNAKKELSTYIGPAAFGHFLPHQHRRHQYHHQLQGASPTLVPVPPFAITGTGLAATAAASPQGLMAMSEQQGQQMVEMHQIVALGTREQEMGAYSQQQGCDRMADSTMVAFAAGGQTSRMASVRPAQLLTSPFTIEMLRQPLQYAEQPRAKARSERMSSGLIGPSS